MRNEISADPVKCQHGVGRRERHFILHLSATIRRNRVYDRVRSMQRLVPWKVQQSGTYHSSILRVEAKIWQRQFCVPLCLKWVELTAIRQNRSVKCLFYVHVKGRRLGNSYTCMAKGAWSLVLSHVWCTALMIQYAISYGFPPGIRLQSVLGECILGHH